MGDFNGATSESPFAEQPDSQPASTNFYPAYPTQPPLGIGHMMLWMVGSSITIVLYQYSVGESSDFGPSWLKRLEAAMSLGHGIVGGLAAAGVILAIYRLATGGVRFPCQPGHWLLLISGAFTLIYPLSRILVRFAWSSTSRVYLPIAFITGFAAIAYTVLCFRKLDTKYWRVYWALLATHSLWTLVYQLTMMTNLIPLARWATANTINWCLQGLLFLAMITVLWCDLRGPIRRDWLHWVGIGQQLLTRLLTIAFYVAFHLLQRILPFQ